MIPMRIMAGILAAGGALWGLFCLPFLIGGDWVHLNRTDLSILAGYLVTIGYFIRCFSNPPLSARRAIWGFSTIVQGGWLSWYIWGAIHGGARASAFEFVAVLWWLFAFVVSLVGLFTEPHAKSA
jgi:hypothetical protein